MSNWMMQYLITPLIIIISAYIVLRLYGKKAVAQMSGFDLIIVIMLGTIISGPLVVKQLGTTLWYITVISSVYIGYSYLALNNKLRWVAHPSPSVLIRNGDIDENELRRNRLTVDELIQNLRSKGYTKISDVELAVLESDGLFSVIPKSSARPIQLSDIIKTPSGLDVQPQPSFIPIPLIMEGQVIEHNLKYTGKDREWLMKQLLPYGIQEESLNKVTLATLDSQGRVLVDIEKQDINSSDPNQYMPGEDQ